jgi:hypothetical protein
MNHKECMALVEDLVEYARPDGCELPVSRAFFGSHHGMMYTAYISGPFTLLRAITTASGCVSMSVTDRGYVAACVLPKQPGAWSASVHRAGKIVAEADAATPAAAVAAVKRAMKETR